MHRRKFLKNAGALGCGLLLTGRYGAASACESRPAPGVQLYTLRASLRDGPEPVLAALSEMGLREVELFGVNPPASGPLLQFGMSPSQLRTVLDRYQLTAPMAHVDNVTNLDALADFAGTIGAHTLIMPLGSEFTDTSSGWRMVGARSLAQVDGLAQRLNRAGAGLAERGIGFGYHNHHVEFLPVEGRIAFDYLMEQTDPDLVKAELDVGWLAAAGMDPVTYLNRYRDRVVGCHLKDYAGEPPQGDFAGTSPAQLVEPGSGTVDFAAVLRAMRDTGVDHGFIEIDVSQDPMAAVTRGHRHLRQLQGC